MIGKIMKTLIVTPESEKDLTFLKTLLKKNWNIVFRNCLKKSWKIQLCFIQWCLKRKKITFLKKRFYRASSQS